MAGLDPAINTELVADVTAFCHLRSEAAVGFDPPAARGLQPSKVTAPEMGQRAEDAVSLTL